MLRHSVLLYIHFSVSEPPDVEMRFSAEMSTMLVTGPL